MKVMLSTPNSGVLLVMGERDLEVLLRLAIL